MALDWYLKKFKEVYPTSPKLSEVFKLYQTALAEFSELEIDAACEMALKECKYFPSPAELLALIPPKDNFSGTSTFDTSADFVPVKDWYEKFSDTHNLHIWADKYGRKKAKIILASPEHNLIGWPQHWEDGKTSPINWEEARKKIGAIAKAKSL